MNNIILIRGDKIAFSKLPGNWGSGFGYSCPDLKDLIVDMGLFIPCHDHGMQALQGLTDDTLFKPWNLPDPHTVVVGNKGVLITAGYDNEVEFHHVRQTENRKINSMPIRAGEDGFHIVSSNDANADLMSMAVRLTKTIEDAVAMYCRHVMSNRNHIEIMTKAQLKDFMTVHYLPHVLMRLGKKLMKEEKKVEPLLKPKRKRRVPKVV